MKKIVGTLLILVLISYVCIHLTFVSIPVADVYNEAVPQKANDIFLYLEKSLFSFVDKNLIGKDGSIATNLQKYDGSKDTLSESIGLLLNYCLLTGKKELFDKEIMFLKNKMLVDRSFVKWRTGKSNCNASIDDLRIIRALMNAYDKWGTTEYLDLAGFMQESIYKNQVSEHNLYELYDWNSGKSKHTTPLCYLDLYTIDRISEFDNGWLQVEDNALYIIANSRINNFSPFYYKYYDYDTGKYSMDEEYKKDNGVCLTYTLYTAIHLVEVNEDTSYLTEWLINEAEKGKLYAWYNPFALKPINNIESTAVYALAAIYAQKIGETALYDKLINIMKKFMVLDNKSKYFGGFGDQNTKYFHSFDNLSALLALAFSEQ